MQLPYSESAAEDGLGRRCAWPDGRASPCLIVRTALRPAGRCSRSAVRCPPPVDRLVVVGPGDVTFAVDRRRSWRPSAHAIATIDRTQAGRPAGLRPVARPAREPVGQPGRRPVARPVRGPTGALVPGVLGTAPLAGAVRGAVHARLRGQGRCTPVLPAHAGRQPDRGPLRAPQRVSGPGALAAIPEPLPDHALPGLPLTLRSPQRGCRAHRPSPPPLSPRAPFWRSSPRA
jgi:hypothetical protein